MTTIRLMALAGLVLACNVAPAAAAPFAYVSNASSANISVIDVATNAVSATIPLPPGCNSVSTVALDPAATRLYLSCNSNNIAAIDTATNTVGTPTFACNSSTPIGLAVHPAGTRLYAGCGGTLLAGHVAVIDTGTNAVLATVPVGSSAFGIALDPTGSRAYVTAVDTDSVVVIDTATNTVTATIPVGDGPADVVINPAGSRAYVSNNPADTVSVIDIATNTVVATIPVGDGPRGLALSPDGSRLLVANNGNADSVSIIATATNTVSATVALGANTDPRAIAITPDGTRAYIANQTGDNVSVMDLATNALSPTIPVGDQPTDIAIVPATPSTVTIDQAAAQGDPAVAGPINFTVVFNESVTGFDAADVSFAGSTAGGALTALVTGGPVTYNVAVSGMTSNGTVVASVVAGAAADSFGARSLASTSTDNAVTLNDPPPAVTIDQAAAQADPAPTGPINFTVVFSENVTGFDGADVSFAGSTAGGTLTALVTGGPATYNVAVSGMTSNGNVVASVVAGAATGSLAGASLASTSTDNTVTLNDPPPSVTIDQALLQADPTPVSPINFTVVFSESVTGFAAADVSFAGSTVAGTLAAVVTGGPTTYNVAVSGMTSNGNVVASVVAGAATGSLGGASLASTSTDNTVAFGGIDTTPPTVTINQAVGQADPAGASPILFTVVFSEPVTGFTNADVVFTGSTAAGALAANVTGSGASYTVSVTGMTGNGLVVASIPAGAAADAASNASIASTSTDNSVTYTGASAIVTTYSAPSATGSGTITASFTGGGPTCSFSGPAFIGSPPGSTPIPPTAPAGGIGFPHGLFAFTTINCTPGSTLAFTVTYPGPAVPAGTQYWKYGPEPGNATPHWYVLPATITGNVATFTITDGAQGDDDLAANGTIVDQGGPGFPFGASAQQTPTMSQWALGLMALLMALGAAGGLRRRSR